MSERRKEVIIIRMPKENILPQTRDAINKKLKKGLILVEAAVDDKFDTAYLQLIFSDLSIVELLDSLDEDKLKELLGAVSLIVDPLGQELIKKAASEGVDIVEENVNG